MQIEHSYKDSEMDGLFRPQVLEHQRGAWIGDIQVLRPLSLHVLTAFVVIAAMAVLAFLLIAHHTSRARLSGVLMPDRGVIRLMPPQPAQLAECRVTEGQHVRQGDVLFVLQADREAVGSDTRLAVERSFDERVRSLRASIAQQTLLQQARQLELERRVVDLRSELAQVSAGLDLNRERLALASQSQARLRSLNAENFVSPAQVQAKDEEVLGLRAQIADLERQRTAKQGELNIQEAQRRELPLREANARAELERELQEMEQGRAEAQSRQRLVIRAPQDAVVTALTAEPGQSVAPGVPLASLLPHDARLQAQLFAPSSAVGFVRSGQPVQLRFQAYPYQKFGHQSGRVLAVSQAPMQGVELAGVPLARGAADEPMYRITVELERQTVAAYGEDRTLAAGMQLEADVLLDRRRLIEWLFEPVLGFAGRV